MFSIPSLKIVVFSLGVACAASAGISARADDAPTDQNDLPSERIKPKQGKLNESQSAPARLRQNRLELAVRNLMTQTGFPDAAMQNAVIAHMKNEARARDPLRKSGETLFLALQSPRVTDEQMNILLEDFQAALEADRQRREAAELALDAKIGFAKNARLQSMLLLFGIIGDGALFVPLREAPHPQNDYVPPTKTPPANPQETVPEEAPPANVPDETAPEGTAPDATAPPEANGYPGDKPKDK